MPGKIVKIGGSLGAGIGKFFLGRWVALEPYKKEKLQELFTEKGIMQADENLNHIETELELVKKFETKIEALPAEEQDQLEREIAQIIDLDYHLRHLD